MSLLDKARYHARVSVAGRTALEFATWRRQWNQRRPHPRQSPHLAPPLDCTPRLKNLIERHYFAGRHANLRGPVAWVTSGAPVEFLLALGFYTLYPENHGAVCGIRRVARELCEEAEAVGYSRDLCSYARTDIGSVLTERTPVGRLPRPDLLLCCTNICQTVLYWYQVLAEHFGVPLVLVDTPFLYGEAPDHTVRYVREQLDEAVTVAEHTAGRSLSARRLQEVTRRSRDAVYLWMQVLDTARHRPTPITAFDAFIHMAPIVEMRGATATVHYYRDLLSELLRRREQGVGALTWERHRLVWDNLPVWPRLRWLSERLASRGVALVGSTYTQAWGELAHLVDPERPLDSAANLYLHPILNRGTGHKLQTIQRMVEDYHADGVLLHSDRSCKPYSIGQMDQRDRLADRLGVPALLWEADHNDPRSFSEEPATARLDSFLEILES